MSSCLILQNKNDFYIGADTACSVKINGVYYRYVDNAKKIFTHGKDVYFCSGNLSYVNNVVDWINTNSNNSEYICVDHLSKYLNENYSFDNHDFDIEIIICRITNHSEIYQLSQYNNFNPILYTNNEDGINIICCGYKTEELFSMARKMIIKSSCNVNTLYKSIYNEIADNKTGGELILYHNNSVILKNKIDEKNIQYSHIEKNLHLLLAKAVVAGYIEGSSIVGGTIKIGDRGDGTYNFEVNEDGIITMSGGSGTAKDINDTKNQIENINAQKMYQVRLSYSGSNIMTRKNQFSSISCKVYSWDEDITSTLDPNLFNWKRVSDNSDSDIEWNNSASHMGTKTINISTEDILNHASFNCDVNLT